MTFKKNPACIVLAGATSFMLLGSVSAKADLTQEVLGFNIENQQTGSGVSLVGTFFSAAGSMNTVGDFTQGTLTYPSGTQTLLPGYNDGPNIFYQTGYSPDLPSLQALFPFGIYTVQGTAGNEAPSSAVATDYEGGPFGSVPALTSGSFSALQGLNPFQSNTVNFNGFSGVGADQSFIFFTIEDLDTDTDVVADEFLDPSTTSVTINSGTLSANTPYQYELIYDNRFVGSDLNGSGISTYQLFDNRTFGDFTTGTPEPGFYVVLALGLAGLFFVRRHRSA